MDGHLAGKVIVIVGGTSGLGAAAAAACVAAGGRVVLVGRSEEKASAIGQTLGASCATLPGDACQPTTAQQAMDLAYARFGRADALYHVAGGSGRRFGDGPLHELTDEGLDKVWAWNLRSVVLSNRAAVRCWLERNTPGVILNMTSVLAFSPSPRHFATHAYAATKAGVIGLTQACAAYYAPQRIRFNAIAPGLVRTPMAERAAGDATIQHYIQAKQPLAEGMCQSQDLNGAVVFLLSDQSAMMTGQVITVDGGWTISEGPEGNTE